MSITFEQANETVRVECDECHLTYKVLSAVDNPADEIEQEFIARGWRFRRDGRWLCPKCAEKERQAK